MKSEKKFLALTALEDFWDTNQSMIFIGECCKLYSRKDYWGRLEAETLSSPLTDRNIYRKSFVEVNHIYEKYCIILAKSLNEYHAVKLSERYWRILIGCWLFNYIHVIFDKYTSLITAINEFSNLKTIILSKEEFVVFEHCVIDAVSSIELYNLQLYSSIVKKINGIDYLEKKHSSAAINNNTIKKRISQKVSLRKVIRSVLQFVRECIADFMIRRNGKIALYYSYFNGADEYYISKKTNYTIFAINRDIANSKNSVLFSTLRRDGFEAILNNNGDGNTFELLLNKMIVESIPLNYLEKWEEMKDVSMKRFPYSPSVIFSAVGWWIDDYFKHWAGFCKENNNAILLGTQHGGNYGVVAIHSGEDFERSVVDKYYTWGWDEPENKKLVKMPSTKLSNNKIMSKHSQLFKKNGIVFASTHTPRYLHRLENWTNYERLNVLKWEIRFLKSLDPRVFHDLSYRAHQEDYLWSIQERIDAEVDNMVYEDWSTPFFNRIKQVRLYVTNHISTTYCEALSMNVPTIMFIDPIIEPIRPNAKEYFSLLYKHGILYYSPESAAQTINKYYYRIEEWWNEEKRQNAIKLFVDRFAYTSNNYLIEWMKELLSVLHSG